MFNHLASGRGDQIRHGADEMHAHCGSIICIYKNSIYALERDHKKLKKIKKKRMLLVGDRTKNI